MGLGCLVKGLDVLLIHPPLAPPIKGGEDMHIIIPIKGWEDMCIVIPMKGGEIKLCDASNT